MELIGGPTPAMTAMLDRLEPCLAAPLFDAAARKRLRTLAGHLPPARYLLFETHLASPTVRADLSIGMTTAVPEALSAAAWLAHPGPVLLEYDLDGGSSLAGLFATFSRRVPADEATLLGLAEGVLGPCSAAVRNMIARAAASQVKDRSWITHFGAMLGRPGRPVRLNVGGRSADDLRDYVSVLDGGLRVLDSLDRLLDLFEDAGATRIAALDLAEAVQPRVGVECHFDAGPGEWPELLARLCACGLCTSAEAAAICRWPAEEDGESPLWPEPFRSLDILLASHSRGRLVRSINHVKLVAEADGVLRAKAYLAAHYVRDDLSAHSELAA